MRDEQSPPAWMDETPLDDADAWRLSVDPVDPVAASDRANPEDRRERQRAENVAIGEGSNTIPTATVCTVDEMIERFVFIKDGSQVAPLDRPQAVLALADFRNAMSASKHWVEVDGKKRAIPAAKCWLESPNRLEAEALTFRAGGPRMTIEPASGRAALNLWAGYPRSSPPADWAVRARLFIDHIEWLWGPDAGAFLDWLAHIEQRPGVLPHYGWVHISREHGKGRNWVSSVLTRLWPGYVAASLDLIPILDGGFNGRISRKVLAIVDEINEGGNTSYRHANKLRQLVTEEQRTINPKYGRQREEYNSTRWLMFSNHTGALPLNEDDRRWWIVSHDGRAKDGDYYTRLYGSLSDPQFIASVAELLGRRDLSSFRPGQRPPMNSAKAELVAFSQSDDDAKLKDLAASWPLDIIMAFELDAVLGEYALTRSGVRHALDRAGLRKIGKIKFFDRKAQGVYTIRNHLNWSAKTAEEQRTYMNTMTLAQKLSRLDVCD